MKNNIKTLLSLFAIVVFIILNWATSQDVEMKVILADVYIYQDTLLIITNLESELNIKEAYLSLILEQDSLNYFYNIETYDLAALTSDTLEMTEFRYNPDNSPFPDSLMPDEFNLSFMIDSDELGFFSKEF